MIALRCGRSKAEKLEQDAETCKAASPWKHQWSEAPIRVPTVMLFQESWHDPNHPANHPGFSHLARSVL